MYKYLLTILSEKNGYQYYSNIYYEIDYELDTLKNIEKIIKSIEYKYDCKNVTIIFFVKLK